MMATIDGGVVERESLEERVIANVAKFDMKVCEELLVKKTQFTRTRSPIPKCSKFRSIPAKETAAECVVVAIQQP